MYICATHIDFGGLGKSPDRVNVVIENDDAHHHPHAEQHGVCVSEPTTVLSGNGEKYNMSFAKEHGEV